MMYLLVFVIASFIGTCFSQDLKIEPDTRRLLLREGSVMVLNCTTEGETAPIWTSPYGLIKLRDDRETHNRVKADGTVVTTRTLTVKSVGTINRGTYYCKAGSREATIEVTVVTETRTEKVYNFGDDSVLLSCEADVDAEEGAVWWKAGEKIEDGEKFDILDNNSIVVKNLDRDDAGRYIARYKLKTGEDYDCIVDYTAGPLVLDMDKSVNKDEEKNLVIKCEVKGWPTPKVTWLKGGEIVQASNRVKFSSYNAVEDAEIEIDGLTFEDEGDYTCKAYSARFNQTEQKSIKLRVKDKLDWLWPLLGIVAEGIALVVLILLFEKIKKKKEANEHAHEQ